MSKIKWTDETWNPIAGCTVISSGCDNCYAMRMAYRLEAMGLSNYQGTTRKNASGRTLWTGKINFDEKALLKPLSWKNPRMIFVNSMSDLFHENVPDEWIDKVFAVMAFCPQHTFQILTKRPERMRDYINKKGRNFLIGMACGEIYYEYHDADAVTPRLEAGYKNIDITGWPMSNVWLLVSVEDQKTANERILYLLNTPAAVRGVSIEPALSEIDLECIDDGLRDGCHLTFNALTGMAHDGYESISGIFDNPDPKLDWVIVGGESGPNARPMHPEWARSLRDQCKAANLPFFFKQWGEWSVKYDRDKDDPDWRDVPNTKNNNERFINIEGGHGFHGERVCFIKKVGKKKAGNILDGEVIQQMPGDV
ncbi:MAG: phage Gp37/Gp68 family protein [Emcibacter sp.]|nr:phage Gp37/Gp68 family protein [Emcibacter sp.]